VLVLMEDVVFYDGYAGTVDEPVPEGVLRHSNSLHAIQFTDEQLAAIQSTLKIGVIVGALCDNYDRIGSVHLALVPKGAKTYVPAEVQRLELARFITPFMNMNKDPKTVPYQWDADNVVPILKDEQLRADYDLWFELMIFGVPYAANTEVPGCADRNDTQLGSLLLFTDSTRAAPDLNVLLPAGDRAALQQLRRGRERHDRDDPQDPRVHAAGRHRGGPAGAHHLEPRRQRGRRGVHPPRTLRIRRRRDGAAIQAGAHQLRAVSAV
jgi:hypothetical protein